MPENCINDVLEIASSQRHWWCANPVIELPDVWQWPSQPAPYSTRLLVAFNPLRWQRRGPKCNNPKSENCWPASRPYLLSASLVPLVVSVWLEAPYPPTKRPRGSWMTYTSAIRFDFPILLNYLLKRSRGDVTSSNLINVDVLKNRTISYTNDIE